MKRMAWLVSLVLLAGCENGGIGAGGRDDSCDDTTTLVCAMAEPECASGFIPAIQDGCWVCVAPATCSPMRDDSCDDTTTLVCAMTEPECTSGLIPAIQDGCWMCVAPATCSPMRDDSCDDTTTPLCNMPAPECDETEILAYQDQCYACVNPETCAPWGVAGCAADEDCDVEDYCDPCASSSCPSCEDCLAGCVPHGCPTETELLCFGIRPDCEAGEVAILENGCWVCVSMATCQ